MKLLNLIKSTFVAFVLTSIPAHAVLVSTFDDIVYWIGSGSNQAAMVIQWNDGNSPQSVVWGFRWDGTETVTAQDMLFAVAGNISVSEGSPSPETGADSRLGISLIYYSSFGYMLDGVTYNQVGLGGEFTSVLRIQEGYSAEEESWTLYTIGMQESWPTEAVLPADFGMSTLTLTDGTWYGWSYTAAFLPPDYYPPISFTFDQPTAAAIPEPSAALLVAAAGAMIYCWKRHRSEKCRI